MDRSSIPAAVGSLSLMLFLCRAGGPARAAEVCDDFPEHHGEWLLRVPECGPTAILDEGAGILQIHIPWGDFDSWMGVDRGPTLERTDMGAGDWVISTRVSLGNSPATEHWTFGLCVAFGPDAGTDRIFWGLYNSDGNLRLERSGRPTFGDYPITPAPVSIQIEKSGSTYYFRHRSDDAGDWILDRAEIDGMASANPVSWVGLYAKNFASDPELYANYDYFCLAAPDPAAGPITTDPITAISPLSDLSYDRNADGSISLAWTNPSCPDTTGEIQVIVNGTLFDILTADATSTVIAPPFPGGGDSISVKVMNDPANPLTFTIWNAVGVCDDFPEHRGEWLFRVPKCGPTAILDEDAGILRIHVPHGDFDSWMGVDRGPTLERTDMGAGDWVISTRVSLGNSPATEHWTFGLCVAFGPDAGTDRIFWGLYNSGGNLRLERSGRPTFGDYPITPAPVSIQVEKSGSTYYFRHRSDDGQEWTLDRAESAGMASSNPVSWVGLYAKNFATVPELMADFDYFCLAVPGAGAPGPVTTDPIPAIAPLSNLSFSRNLDGSISLAWSNAFCPDTTGKIEVLVNGDLASTLAPDAVGTTIAPHVPGGAGTYDVTVMNDPVNPLTCQFYATEILDDFPEHHGEWLFRVPKCGPTATLDPNAGILQIHVPAGDFDSWMGVDRGPTLQRRDMGSGNWIISTRISLGNSPATEHWTFGLCVAFGSDADTDRVFWGLYNTGGNLRLERSGRPTFGDYGIAGNPVSIQIERSGSTYYFRHRSDDAQGWTLDRAETDGMASTNPVSWIGLYAKNFATAPELIANFDYFLLEGPGIGTTGAATTEAIPAFSPLANLNCDRSADGTVSLTWSNPFCFDATGAIDVMVNGQLVSTLPADAVGTVLTPPFPGGSDIVRVKVMSDPADPLSCTVSRFIVDTCDEFDVDPTAGGPWVFRTPVLVADGPWISVDENPGFLRMHVPSGAAAGSDFDSWHGVDRAPTLERTDMRDGDWVISSRMQLSPTPGAPYWAIGLGFGWGTEDDTDRVYWGPYARDGNLRMERSGHDGQDEGIPVGTVSVQIEKSGSTYYFRHRMDDADIWTLDRTETTLMVSTKPVSWVGLFVKTYAGGAAPEVNADFDYFCLQVPEFVPTVPAAPTGLTAAPGDGTMALDWADNRETDLLGYDVYRSAAGGAYAKVNAALLTKSEFADSGLANGTECCYLVRAVNPTGESDPSARACATPLGPPPAKPAGLTATPGVGTVALDWADNVETDLLGYEVFRSEAGGAYAKVNAGLLKKSEYSDPGLPDGTECCYVVRAVNPTGESDPSDRACATPTGNRPANPKGLTARPGVGVVALDWADNTETDLLGYDVYRSEAGGAYARVNAALLTKSEFSDSGLANGTAYCYVVRAVDPAGASGDSDKACATPRAIFRRGDADANGAIELTDAIFILTYQFLGGDEPPCFDAADADDNGSIELTDPIYILSYQFLGGDRPPDPGPEICGPEPPATPPHFAGRAPCAYECR